MESKGDNTSNVDQRTNPSTSPGEGQQFNSENKPELSFSPFTSELTPQDHNHFMTNATTPLTNDQTHSHSEIHHNTSSGMEKGVENSINSYLEAFPSNLFGELHLSPLVNDSAPSSLPSQPPQNPFLLDSGASATNTTQPSSHVMQQENGGMHNSSTDDIQALHPSLAPSTYESSPGNPFQVPTTTTTIGSQEVVENHDHEHERHHHTLPLMDQDHWSFPSEEARTHNPSKTHASSSSQQLDPFFTLEATQNQQSDNAIDNNHEGHNNIASSNLETDSTTSVVGENHASSPSQQLDPLFTLEATQNQQLDNAVDKNHEGHNNMARSNSETDTTTVVGENHASSSSQQLDPLFTLESAQNNQLGDAIYKNHEGQNNMASSNLETDTTTVVGENYASSSSQQLDPLFTLESAQNNQLNDAIDKNHERQNKMASCNLETDTTTVVGESSYINHGKKLGSSMSSFSTASESSTQDQILNSINASSNNNKVDTNLPPKLENDSLLDLEPSDDDIPISSMPNHGQQSSIDVATSSTHRIPSHDFASNKTKTQWSTASNESLFSIQMGNTSFCNDMAWLNKYGKMDKPGEMNASQSNQPPLPPQQPQETKFNDISQSTTEQHEGVKVTEEKAAETMREVIMENSVTTRNKSKGELTFADRARHSNMLSKSNDPSHPSNGSTKSFAFKVLPDKDKTPSSKRGEERRNQQKQSQQLNLRGRPAAAQNSKSTSNASQNKWLCCFTCCH